MPFHFLGSAIILLLISYIIADIGHDCEEEEKKLGSETEILLGPKNAAPLLIKYCRSTYNIFDLEKRGIRCSKLNTIILISIKILIVASLILFIISLGLL